MNSNKYIHSSSLHPIICTILKYHHWCCNQKENYHSVPNFDFLWLKPSPINVEKSQKKNKVKSHNRFKKSLIRSKIRWRFFSLFAMIFMATKKMVIRAATKSNNGSPDMKFYVSYFLTLSAIFSAAAHTSCSLQNNGSASYSLLGCRTIRDVLLIRPNEQASFV